MSKVGDMKNSALGFAFLVMAFTSALVAQEPGSGVPPRAKADDYAVKAQAAGVTFAASLISAKQVRDMFAYDISSSYVVFEVACYIDTATPRQILREDFVVKGRAQGELTHQVEAETVASVMAQKNMPKPPSNKPSVGVGTTVGYESGTDPVTGRKVHDVYTSTGVGVGIGNDGRYPPVYNGPPVDRDMLQAQLRARSLPEGKFDHAIAGYLFFPRAGFKTQQDGRYALEYLMDSKEVVLPVPDKTR